MTDNEIIVLIQKIIFEIRDNLYDGNLPVFEPAYSKSKCKEIEVTPEYFLKEFNKRGNRKDREMGISYTLKFFSPLDLDYKKSIVYLIDLGGSGGRVPDSVVVSFPSEIISEKNNFEKICNIFKSFVSASKPYFSFLLNDKNGSGRGGYWKEKPTFVHTLNYFDEETAQKIGIEKLRNLQSAEEADGGWYIKLLNEPLDEDNPSHLEKQKQISEFLGLTN
ncbi:MAG: hypothetical protein IJO22_08665 [Oscillospiraceae bacterium]|nr:hypothetical protein [Oscillospiraceae bacterium]